jgi:TetR/AcrR family transcriptional regulator
VDGVVSEGEPGAAGGPGAARRAPAPGQRQRDAERSRQALLAAALDEFAEHGYAGTRVASIAQRAGVNKQLINYYFGSKEGLYLALQRSWLERAESLSGPGVPLPDLVARYLADALRDPRPIRLLLWHGLAGDAAPELERRRPPDVDQVKARQEAGEVAADLDPAAVLLAGLGMVLAPVVLPRMARELLHADPGSEEFLDRYAEQLRRMVSYLSGR